MKQHTFAACAAALAFVALPAWAGDGASISQTGGSANTAAIEQIGSGGNNDASIIQGDLWRESAAGSGNVATIQQYNVDFAHAEVHQLGSSSDYRVRQSDGRGLRVDINVSNWESTPSDLNTVLVEQSGFDSEIFVDQVSGSYNRAEIVQAGMLNVAAVLQDGNSNQATIYQSGSNLQATIGQRGYGNVATIRQGY